MVKSENLVVDNTLDQSENSKAHQLAAGKQLSGPPEMPAVSSSPNNHEAEHEENVCGCVEKAVEPGV